MPTLDEILADAKRVANKRSVVDDANAFAASEAAARREAEKLTPMGTVKRYGAPLVEAAKAAALPAAFLGGPVGMTAGSILALEGINDAIKDPTALNVGMAGLGALPFAKPVGRLVKGAREANVIKRVRQTEGAGDMGAAFRREIPYRAGSGTSAGKPPSMTDLKREAQVPIRHADTTGDFSEEALDRYIMGQQPAAMQELSRPGAQRFMNEGFQRNNPVFRKMQLEGSFGARGIDDAIEAMNREVPASSVVNELPVEQTIPGASEVDELLASLGGRLDEVGPVRKPRPAEDFVHPADTSGAAFGFEELPEISEGELSRIQELFKRVTAGR